MASTSRRSRLSRSSSRASVERLALGIGEEAADADRHVGEPAGRVQARARDEPQVERGRRGARRGPATREQREHAGARLAGAHAREALLDEDAVGLVEAHDVGDGAEGDQVEQRREIGLGAEAKSPSARRRARVASST